MLSISEIRTRASAFALRWKDEVSEDAEAKTFWDEFLQVFGVDRRRVATFEKQVAKAGAKQGFIDLFWPGLLIVEHKSIGRDLDRAFTQAMDYFPGLKDHELPRYVIVSDFQRIRLHDLVDGTDVEIRLVELPERIDLFGFISGYVPRKFRDEDPVNVKAAELMGRLHDAIKATGYEGHQLEVFLTRLLFCMFGDDTGIFNRDAFVSFLETKTRDDGMDVGPQLSFLFQILNTPLDKRPKNLDEEYQAFPYVNGNLFAEVLPTPSFDSTMRERLLECANFDWTFVSPAVFGAMFQGVMNDVERRNLGAHYTSEKNILKVVSGLFLDEIEEELNNARRSEHRLRALHDRISRMRFLDPACGCGNFLIVTYKELRRIEIEILQHLEALGKLSGKGQRFTDVSALSRLSVHSMFGIEIEEFPARIAEVALWLIDHIMNAELARTFGGYFVRLPLTDGPNILIADALETDWRTAILDTAPDAEWFILGNPPFVGSKMMSDAQRSTIKRLFGNIAGSGVMDFVTGWYVKAAQAIQGTDIRCAFVSTNSISQGEQVGILWKHLVQKYDIKIHFAHRTFRWSNEAKGVAAVHCVIVGFGFTDVQHHVLHEASPDGAIVQSVVKRINGYLVEGPDVFIQPRNTPLCDVPPIATGNKPIDGGHYLFTEAEMNEFLRQEPRAEALFRPWYGAVEYINGTPRWCLFLRDTTPETLRSMPLVIERVNRVREYRLQSDSVPTRKLASVPTRFHVENTPTTSYLVIPEVSSIRREYIPIGWFDCSFLSSNKLRVIESATLFHFAVLQSLMHMSWVRHVSGRLKSDYSYANSVAYNAFPWPTSHIELVIAECIECARKVLDVRARYDKASLADLYDPVAMPPDLRKAHDALDKAVDQCYRKEPFTSERERVEFLFALYRKLTEGFGVEEGKELKKKRMRSRIGK